MGFKKKNYTTGDWTSLPHHLLDLISDKLDSPIDYLQFAATCVSWHFAAKSNPKSNKFIPSSLDHHVPMLLVYNNREQNTRRLYNVMNNKFLQAKHLVPNKHVRFCGSSKGWLASVSSDYSVTLQKSYFSIEHDNYVAPSIRLPSIFPPQSEDDMLPDYRVFLFAQHEYYIHKVLLTADPLVNSNDCTVVVIFGSYYDLAFIRLGKDTSWTRIQRDYYLSDYEVHDVLYHNDQFYAVDSYGTIISFDIPESGNSIVRLVLLGQYDREAGKRYLVTSPGGEIWHIIRVMDILYDDITRVTTKFKLFRIDDVDSEDAKSVAIESLGDVALFLGDNSSISVVASKYFGCKENAIYFAHDADFVLGGWSEYCMCDLGIYEVASKSFKLHYSMGSFTLSNMSNHHPLWVVPPLMNL